MQRFNKVQIESVHFTSDDASTGLPYVSEVTGLTPLKLSTSRIIVEAADGTPRPQFRSHKGRPIEISFPVVPVAKYDALVAAVNAAEAGGNALHVVLDGDRGLHDLDCHLEDLDDRGQTIDAGVRDLRIRLRILAVNEPEP